MLEAFYQKLDEDIKTANDLEKRGDFRAAAKLWIEIAEYCLKFARSEYASEEIRKNLIERSEGYIEHAKMLKIRPAPLKGPIEKSSQAIDYLEKALDDKIRADKQWMALDLNSYIITMFGVIEKLLHHVYISKTGNLPSLEETFTSLVKWAYREGIISDHPDNIEFVRLLYEKLSKKSQKITSEQAMEAREIMERVYKELCENL
ncbi:MAG: hypothetical protein KIH08_00430 [Candidatus Freyarchaeota archaeon]|nr:hypothetical protein [Candidatus Jordarchaeia archaeon]MBS7270072.1 hypothetical protein [Candidatus Jordarchaeia archaeon]MBS7279848.1 hypothetical protein [Candidatus Jordarchaeia archaeon]